jgi:hypothetical protein
MFQNVINKILDLYYLLVMLLRNRWPDDPRKVREWHQLRSPVCMDLALQSQCTKIINFPMLLKWYYNIWTTMPVYNTGSLMRQQSTTIHLLKKNFFQTMNLIELSTISTYLDHYLRHSLTDTGAKNHDCCYTVMESTSKQVLQFKYFLSVINHMDFVWLLEDNNTHYHITCIVVAYLCEDPKVLTDILAYGHNPFVTSLGDFKEACALTEDQDVVETRMQRFSPEFLLNMMWQTQTQTDF